MGVTIVGLHRRSVVSQGPPIVPDAGWGGAALRAGDEGWTGEMVGEGDDSKAHEVLVLRVLIHGEVFDGVAVG